MADKKCSIAQMNNEAVMKLIQGDYGKSRFILRAALEHLAQLFFKKKPAARSLMLPIVGKDQFTDWSKNHVNDDDDDDNDEVKIRTMPPTQRCDSDEVTSNYEPQKSDNFPHILFYNRAIILDGSDHSMSSSRQAFNRTTRVLLFNIALIHHTIQRQRPKTRADALHTLRIYQLAWEACSFVRPGGMGVCCSRSGNETCSCWQRSASDNFVMLAILNNMASICTEFNLTIEKNLFLRDMESLLSLEHHDSESVDTDGNKVDSSFFHLNIIACKCVTSAPSA